MNKINKAKCCIVLFLSFFLLIIAPLDANSGKLDLVEFRKNLNQSQGTDYTDKEILDMLGPEAFANIPPELLNKPSVPNKPPIVEKTKAEKLFDEIMATGEKCAEGKDTEEYYQCYIQSAPKKCEQQMIDYLTSPRGEWALRRAAGARLIICIKQCVDASFISRMCDECRRKIK